MRGHLEQELAALEKQQSMKKDQAELEKEVTAYCKELKDQLGADSYEEKRLVFAALDVKIVANQGGGNAKRSISPGFTTNSHTLACNSSDSYSVVIVELESVVEKHGRFLQVRWLPV